MNTLIHSSKRGKNNDDGLIPLINIVFLLLIFFMIAGQISSDQGLTIEPPVSHSKKALVTPPLVIVLDSEQTIFMDGLSIDLTQLKTQLLRYVETHSAKEQQLALKADKTITATVLDEVLNTIRASGINAITLYTLNTEIKQ
jgi:biopolymer transport protein ExbD